jgi:hypothetical protein
MLLEMVILGKILVTLTAGLVVVSAIQFLSKMLELLTPIIKAVAPLFEWAVGILVGVLNQATPVVVRKVRLAYAWFRNTILGIRGIYSKKLHSREVTVTETAYVVADDGTIRKISSTGFTDDEQLPDYIREALKQRTSVEVVHSDELLRQVDEKILI